MEHVIGTLARARQDAQKFANKTGMTVMIYRSTLRDGQPDEPAFYGVCGTLPVFAERIELIYPNDKRAQRLAALEVLWADLQYIIVMPVIVIHVYVKKKYILMTTIWQMVMPNRMN
jgi:hypothetical protein